VRGEASYDVYVKKGGDRVGGEEFGEAVAHFVERDNAVALKRRLVARGETVRVERSVVPGLSEEEKERLFRDYSRVPEYEPARSPAPSLGSAQEPPGGPESVFEEPEEAEFRSAAGGDQEGAEWPWWRRVLGG
jgi:hypothetical protein